MIRRLVLSAALSLPMMAGAHPHIFVETGLTLLVDDVGRPSAIEVSWRYDELYSLLMLEELGLDGDYDGLLTPVEELKLQGFDMNWDPGYNGDLEVRSGEELILLGPPKHLITGFDQGKITSKHRRPLSPGPRTLTIRVFDPWFYTAYDLSGGITVPENCVVTREQADLDAAYAEVDRRLAEGNYGEEDYPEVGEAFADRVLITCAPLS